MPSALQSLPALFHCQQALHDLQVIAEDQQIVPAVAVLAEGPHRLQRDGQRVGQDVLLALLAVINQLVFPLFRRKQDASPFRRKLLALLQTPDHILPLFLVHRHASS